MTKHRLAQDLRHAIAQKLCEIEDLCRAYGLVSLTGHTYIGRDPCNPDMTLMVTNEPTEAAVSAACAWAQDYTAVITTARSTRRPRRLPGKKQP